MENCWEFKKCGREPGGKKAEELGVCPAATNVKVDGINSGNNGGRACWVITATLCGSQVQGGFAEKVMNCMNCEFYKKVWKEEQGKGYMSPSEIMKKLNE